MYIIRYQDAVKAIGLDPVRNLLKISDPNLWKKAWPEGINDWQPDHEIRSEGMGISLFREGTREKVHFHERIW